MTSTPPTPEQILDSMRRALMRANLSSTVRAVVMSALTRVLKVKPRIDPKANAKMDKVIGAICQASGISKTELLGRSRKTHINNARKLALFVIRQEYGYGVTVADMGRKFDRNHSTILQQLQTAGDLISTGDATLLELITAYNNHKISSLECKSNN